jgi:hypothetical protein
MNDMKTCEVTDVATDIQCNEDTGVTPEQIYLDMLAMAA